MEKIRNAGSWIHSLQSLTWDSFTCVREKRAGSCPRSLDLSPLPSSIPSSLSIIILVLVHMVNPIIGFVSLGKFMSWLVGPQVARLNDKIRWRETLGHTYNSLTYSHPPFLSLSPPLSFPSLTYKSINLWDMREWMGRKARAWDGNRKAATR